MNTFKISRVFIETIEELGFDRACNQDSRYYKDKQGHQIKIDIKTNLISLIDSKGFTVVRDEEITEEELKDFLKTT